MLTRCTDLRGVSVKIESASPGNRTRVPRVAGEDSTIEPTTHMQTRHLRITHLLVSDDAWDAITVGGDTGR